MDEAVEICKLRLFLKLVAQVDKTAQLEPLPDIDFNIRAGNTLVGFASLDEARKSVELQSQEELDQIQKQAENIDAQFRAFRDLQIEFGPASIDASGAKTSLRRQLDSLRDKLDRYLAALYDVDPDNGDKFSNWRSSHRPFHWLAEFYGIMGTGGFNVVIGNPPWKEYSAVRKEYSVRGFQTENCGNLHGICTERALTLRSPDGRMSFIVQLPLTSSSRMASVRKVLVGQSGSLLVVPFDDRPGKLFDGLQHCRSVIFLSQGKTGVGNLTAQATTGYQRWPTEARSHLFSSFRFVQVSPKQLHPGQFPKLTASVQQEALLKVLRIGDSTLGAHVSRGETSHFIFYQEATQYWVKATIGLPYYAKNGQVGAPAHGRCLYFAGLETAHAACAVLNSSLFYAYFITCGDCFHLSDGLATRFPVNAVIMKDKDLVTLNSKLMSDLQANAMNKAIRTRDGDRIEYAEFYVSRSKPILDEIDRILAKHYGFTDEELDFILNYDIKYRMGQENGTGPEEDE